MSGQGGNNHDKAPSEITIETLSSPPLQVTPAPIIKRAIAGFVDSALVSALWLFSVYGLGLGPLQFDQSLLISKALASLVLLFFVYFALLEGLFGATLGKALFRLRVLGEDGEQCSLRAAAIRSILRFVDWMPLFYIIAAVSMMVSSTRQRVGDRIARTVVSVVPEKDPNPPPAPFLFH